MKRIHAILKDYKVSVLLPIQPLPVCARLSTEHRETSIMLFHLLN